jgi:hypothetical protein
MVHHFSIDCSNGTGENDERLTERELGQVVRVISLVNDVTVRLERARSRTSLKRALISNWVQDRKVVLANYVCLLLFTINTEHLQL